MPSTTVDVVDFSHYQPTPDWDTLKKNVLGVILKCTEGTTGVDPTFYNRRLSCIARGIPHATYHFLRPGNIGAQMSHYLETVKPRTGERVILDHEVETVSLADLERAVELLLSHPGDLQVTVYSGHVIKQQLGDRRSEILAKTSLWLAQYSDAPSGWPDKTWTHWTLWQFTDKAIVGGFPPNIHVDGNKFNGDDDACIRWLNPADTDQLAPVQPTVPNALPTTPPAAQTDDTPPIVTVSINTPVGVQVAITVNGCHLATSQTFPPSNG